MMTFQRRQLFGFIQAEVAGVIQHKAFTLDINAEVLTVPDPSIKEGNVFGDHANRRPLNIC